MNQAVSIAAISAIALVSACADSTPERETSDLETASTESEADALAEALPAGDFADLKLGAKVVGPQGPEVESALSNAAGNFADMRSYVACPAEMTTCDPNTAPKGTIFTYVHVVIPGEDNDASEGSGTGPDESHIENAEAFSMTMPSRGFTGKVGYSKAEALAAMGSKADVVITCEDGQLLWTVNAGDGGDQWDHREPLTFWWQSTLPPAGPADAYRIHVTKATASGKGPYPAKGEGATNACEYEVNIKGAQRKVQTP